MGARGDEAGAGELDEGVAAILSKAQAGPWVLTTARLTARLLEYTPDKPPRKHPFQMF